MRTDENPRCQACSGTRGRDWYIHRPDLSWWCAGCRGTRQAHVHAYPDCVVQHHDGWDCHGDGSPFIGGSREDLLKWWQQELRRMTAQLKTQWAGELDDMIAECAAAHPGTENLSQLTRQMSDDEKKHFLELCVLADVI